jgi:His-Xaa-Ser system radical SAM maturase HxsC
MCPQPPQKHDPALFVAAARTLDLLKGKHIRTICITGGEPTLLSENFLSILRRCHTEHPGACINILTNAKKLASEKFAREIASATTANDLFCVSLHSDIDSIHDEIVGMEGSYNETQEGIYNLARNRVGIEIRHVITKLNYERLHEFAGHMYRYFPFCSHYAFMSMEMYGLAGENIESVYIDPHEYKEQLRKAVLALHKRGLYVSIYNTPLCLCHEAVRSFSRASISSWKNIWVEACDSCSAKDICCGFFSTSAIPISRYINPIA